MINNKIFGIVLIGIILLISGCTDSKQFYIYEKIPSENLTLYPDGTYKIWVGKPLDEYAGDYRIEGDEIIIKKPFGDVYTLKRQGDKLVDNDGDVWIRG